MLWAGAADAQRLSAASGPQYVEGVVRVKLQPEVASQLENTLLPGGTLKTKAKSPYVTTGVAPLDRIAQKVKAVSMRRVFPYAGKDEAKHKKFGLDLWYDITYSSGDVTPLQVRNLYTSTSGVAYAQRIPVYKPYGGERFHVISPADIAKAEKAAATMPFNDPLLPKQWHYYNDGSINGTEAGYDINVFPAWESGVAGSKDVLVAIIDGGFQIDHPDLKDNLWINEAELNGKPGVDDDGDGYVDDIYGYNFVVNSSNINAHSHGTHVAGTVGATNNNGIGVSGVAGGSDGTGGVKMMVCQVFDSRAGESAVTDFGAALVYAADRGASIAQCSWGMSVKDEEDKSTSEAVRYFTKYGGGDKMNGGLCIFAAGNNGDEGNYYPGCLPEVVAVGAMAADGTAATYTTFGDWVDVTAPGGLMDYGESLGVLSTLPGSQYGYNEGTSMACPHVSGIAALILSKYGNKNFSNETLRTLLTSSVNDFYAKNPTYAGKMGTGYIDAFKALQGQEGSVPDAVADYTLIASHDNVLVEWVIPQSGTEGVIDHHVIYYSTEPITDDTNLERLNSVNVDTKFYSSGDKMSYELTGVKPNTTYYFTIVAYNRWGKASTRSTVKSATTNSGPVAKLDKLALVMTSTAGAPVANGEFTISNTREGVLKYELQSYTASQSLSYSTSNTGKEQVLPGKMVNHDGKMVTAENATTHYIVTSGYKATNYPDTMTYASKIYAYIGENDTDLPNALAQHFTVDKNKYPNGFNLTDLRFGGAYGKNPVIEVYDGSRAISSATKLTTVDYSYFEYNSDIALNEQLHFNPGESFWVVAKFPAGQEKPLGLAYSSQDSVFHQSFMSFDNGATWTQLDQALKGSTYESKIKQVTWAVWALSKNPDWSAVLNADPVKGEVRAGEKQTVKLHNDGQQMPNGTYKFNLHLKTNEAQATDNKVAVTFKVSGYKPSMTSQKLIDFGNLLVGEEKTLSVELTNSGFGAFAAKYGGNFYTSQKTLTCSSDQFKLTNCPRIAARSNGIMNVTFKPTKGGDFTGTVTLTDQEGSTYSFTVRGSATEPAKLALSGSVFDMGDLQVGGEEKTQVVTLKNDGKYPLQYVFPKYSGDRIDGTAVHAHRFGYTFESSFDGKSDVQYEEMPELTDEKDVTSQFPDEYSWQSEAVNIGFKFPFYGKNYDKLYICSTGGVSFKKQDSGTIGCSVPSADCVQGLGYISAVGLVGPSVIMGPDSKVSYGHKDGKLYVSFKNVLTYDANGEGGTTPVSFHMVLTPDGTTTVYYDLYEPWNLRDEGRLVYIGVADPDHSDVFTVIDSDEETPDENLLSNLQTGAAIRLVAPAKSMIKSVSDPSGYLGIGEQKDIKVTLAATDELYAGELTNNLVLNTNDPQNASLNIVFKANITGDGLKADAVLSDTTVDFGSVYRTSSQRRTISLANDGKNTLSVSGVSVAGDKFALDEDVKQAFTVAAGVTKDINVTLNTEASGTVEDKLTVNFADGSSKQVALKANVIGCPQVGVTPDMIEEETPYGTDVKKTLSFSNGGDEPMSFAIASADWFKFDNLEADNKTSQTDYTFKSKTYDSSVAFDWIDITQDNDALHLSPEYFNGTSDQEGTDYKEVELPFEFPFYGKKYTKMWIYDTGFVSFTEPEQDFKMFPPPPEEGLPSKDSFYKNIIAPYWGNHTPDPASTNGVFYKKCDDHVVVYYKNYGNSVMNGMNFEVILRKDGTFKFQYQLNPDGIFVSSFGVCGVMDETGTRAVQPYNELNIKSGNAIEFAPCMSYIVAPGSSVDVPVTIDGSRIAKVYEDAFKVTTNVPGQEQMEIPSIINITGEAEVVMPEKISYTAVAMGNPAYIEFEVKNNGKRAYQIVNAESKMFNWNDNLFQETATLEVKAAQQSGDDDSGIGGGPLALDFGDDDMGTGDEDGWRLFNTSGDGDMVEVGFDPVQFRIHYNNVLDPNLLKDTIKFSIMANDEFREIEVPVEINMTAAPHLTFDKDAIYVGNGNVSSDYTGKEALTLSNDGEYKLHYSLRLDPTGYDEAMPEDDGVGGLSLAPALTKEQAGKAIEAYSTPITFEQLLAADGKRKAKAADAQDWHYDYPYGYPYTNVMYYPVHDPVSNAKAAIMGTVNDIDQNFLCGTRFETGSEGFNLSHVYFVGTVGDLENVDIEATIIHGTKINAKNKDIGHGKLHITKEEGATAIGRPYLLELDKPVFINPNDTFYVMLKFPAGYGKSILMTGKNGDLSPNRYMAYLESTGGWTDLEDLYDQYYSYGAFGFTMACVETEKGSPWIKLLSDKTEGDIEVGENLPLEFAIDAKQAYFTKNNKATLVVHSDDPSQPVVNYHIWLDKNSAPQISATTATVYAAQGKSTNVAVNVTEPENEAFTVSFADQKDYTSVAQYNEEDGVSYADGTFTVPAGQQLKAQLAITPDYGYDKVGYGNFVVTAQDANGNASEATVNYAVEFTNRAPEFTGADELSYLQSEQSSEIAYSTLFSDPDGDEFTATVKTSDASVAAVFASETGFIVNAKKAGTAVLTVEATDKNGASAKHDITVNVTSATGINGVASGNGNLTVNPDNGNLGVTVRGDVASATFRLYNNAGQMIAEKTAKNLHAGDTITLGASSVAPGVYHLNAVLDGKTTNLKFAVK